MYNNVLQRTTKYYYVLQRTTTHYNALQRTTTYCNILQRTTMYYNVLQCTMTYYNVLQRTTRLAQGLRKARARLAQANRATNSTFSRFFVLVSKFGIYASKSRRLAIQMLKIMNLRPRYDKIFLYIYIYTYTY